MGKRPLRWIFLDLNAYFASVQQAERPELRNKPIAVVPLEGNSTCVIAASYEAKAYGIKTGTNVGLARQLCPDLILVSGGHEVYTHYNMLVKKAVQQVLPIDKECSVDEMRFRLLGDEMQRGEAEKIARRMKEALHDSVSPWVKASIGIAPNPFLAKLATDLQKPDGLVVIEGCELPDRLRGLRLTEFCGINRRMEARLKGAGIFNSDDLITRSPDQLRRAFQSVIGERWWYLLRGWDLPEAPTHTKSVGHSHMFAPEFRNDKDARNILIRLTQKAAMRLRSENLFATEMAIYVRGYERSWGKMVKMPVTQDTPTILSHLLDAWEERSFDKPKQGAVTFYGLIPAQGVTPSLFDDTLERAELSRAVDRINQRYGKNRVQMAAIQKVKDTAPERIAFNKTWLFSEGKDDNVFPPPPPDEMAAKQEERLRNLKRAKPRWERPVS